MTKIRVLMVEDREDDALLILRELRRGGFEVEHRRVETATGTKLALRDGPWDIVLCDYNLPSFDARRALKIVNESGLDLPLIIVSGTIGEETAVAAMRAGASDFLVKGKLKRLCAAVERELREKRLRERGVQARRDAERAEQSLELFKQVVENMPLGVILAEWEQPGDVGAFRFIYWNRAGREATNVADDYELIGKYTRDLPALIDTGIADAYACALRTGVVQQLPQQRYGDEHFPDKVFDIRVAKLDARRVSIIFSDVTDGLAQERRLQAAQRLEAVGRLAGGVAHDYNNVITVINTHARLMRLDLDDGTSQAEDCDAIIEAAARASRLTEQMLAFGRRQVRTLEVVDVNEVIRELGRMLSRLVTEDIEIVHLPGKDLGKIRMDLSQLEQVLMNLVVNARDAMPGGGKLTIETRNDDGTNAVIVVRDDGIGMDDETMAHIFEPFYTTKELGRGSGLGLSTVYGIVKQSGGRIEVASEPGRGTAFEIHLPCFAGEAADAGSPTTPAPARRGHETILIVDDEPSVRLAVARALRSYGYHVLTAAHGGEALEVLDAHGAPIDVLLTDLVMPCMGGRELVAKISDIQGSVRAIYMSGHSAAAIEARGRIEDHASFLQKPFTPEILANEVRSILDHESREPPHQSRRSAVRR